jgi:hypothetical protein
MFSACTMASSSYIRGTYNIHTLYSFSRVLQPYCNAILSQQKPYTSRLSEFETNIPKCLNIKAGCRASQSRYHHFLISTHLSPKPSLPVTAIQSFSSSFLRLPYGCKQIVLKQVRALGKRSESVCFSCVGFLSS